MYTCYYLMCTYVYFIIDNLLTWQYKHNEGFFLQVMCELKIAQFQRASTLSMNSSIGGEGRVCTIAK